MIEVAVFGGGCFWCIEAAFQQINGVLRAESGYAGGHVEQPNYQQVCAGKTGHIEVVKISYDPQVIAYTDLLAIFFAAHDPTTLDRQGNDVGPQYRSAIFWQNEPQRQQAQQMIADLDARQIFGAPLVTQLLPPTTVWPAEAHHHDYFLRNPNQGYCAVIIAPKVAKLRQQFADKLKGN
jgi:peptide-methionine (S)-S-oxide reductase